MDGEICFSNNEISFASNEIAFAGTTVIPGGGASVLDLLGGFVAIGKSAIGSDILQSDSIITH